MPALVWLDDHDTTFPSIETAMREPDGLLAVGGDLRPERLLRAYREGIFPWFEEGGPLLWWSPDPRMVMEPQDVHVSRKLRRLIKRQQYQITMDQAFDEVIQACARLRHHSEGTWITPDMQEAYIRLHEQHHAHSVEVRDGEELVGGLYGVSIGPLFFGESMFSLRDNTSRLAFIALARQLQAWNFRLIDCQMPTAHLASLGAREMSRADFKRLLWQYRDAPGQPGKWTFDPQTLYG